jgi:hypothetical protein
MFYFTAIHANDGNLCDAMLVGETTCSFDIDNGKTHLIQLKTFYWLVKM